MQQRDSVTILPPADSGREHGSRIRRFAIIIGLVLVAGFVITFLIRSHEANTVAKATSATASAPPLVNVITVAQAPASITLKLPGATAAWYESTIYARVDGYVGAWTADIGDTVKKGQVLASIETPDLDAQLGAALAKIKLDESQLTAAMAAQNLAKVTYERWRDAPKGVVSEQERDSTKAANDSAAAQVDSAKAQLALDRSLANRYEALSKFKQVTAPYDGKVIERKIDIGNLVTAGSSTNTTLLYRIAQNDPMRIFVDVPQSAAADMRPGVGAKISASNVPDRVFEGKISRTADAIDQSSRTLHVEVDIPNTDQILVPGMYVDVGFDIPSGGLPLVPAAALVFRSSGPQVALVDQNSQIRFQSVAIARDNGNSVEIGSGVKTGDVLALNVSSQIADGEKVEISQSTENSANAPAVK